MLITRVKPSSLQLQPSLIPVMVTGHLYMSIDQILDFNRSS